jgi:hypothetical protein
VIEESYEIGAGGMLVKPYSPSASSKKNAPAKPGRLRFFRCSFVIKSSGFAGDLVLARATQK